MIGTTSGSEVTTVRPLYNSAFYNDSLNITILYLEGTYICNVCTYVCMHLNKQESISKLVMRASEVGNQG